MHGFDVDQADRALVQGAARRLRHQAISDGYAGLPGKHRAFALVLLLDELARHLRELHETVREQVLSSCRALADDG